MLNRGHYPYKWLWNYAGDKFLKPKAHKNFHRCRPTTYYYCSGLAQYSMLLIF